MTDEQLLREALKALDPLARLAEDTPPDSPDEHCLYDGCFVGIVVGDARRARKAATKLEERLLTS